MAKVLLVEDDNNLREIYQARLQAEGYTIVSARDGEEGLVVAKSEKPDLIVADVMMPKISGFEMLDIIRNTDTLKAVKVIMLTALGQSDDQKRADKLGADRYLVKSQVTLEDIVKAAHELLGEENPPAPAGTSEPTAPTSAPTPPAPAEPAPAEPTPNIEVKSAPAEPTPEVKTEAPAASSAETAQQEATEAEAKIEDFVAGATSEPTTPTSPTAAAPAPEPAAPAEPAPAPAPAAAPTADDQAADRASDDKVMSDAVDSLNASLDPKDKDDSASGAAPQPEPDKKEPSGSGGSKKIIQPIENSETKKDIHTLLAEEEAKEAAASAGTVNPPAPTTPPADDQAKPADPNSIAL